ncbi:hypothetical protein PPSIR1_19684 [Plesiocystis pacifica SIR-1]|uniref:SGNH hydrolase-type esterase domain-containing protein n=1 Tax=Plesiocystis pacifica SIR-1 TaxID=391625 RepID=A6GAN6_9BACT|nr:GDSL-type esterase/lipase family protein [Plesiocystis pacifica]EDM77098.1 hypothetical protein PPSIR1_19684 [Plesiocystis pacifica SIR-1]
MAPKPKTVSGTAAEPLAPTPSPKMLARVGSAMVTVVLGVVGVYFVPGAEWARPWTREDPVPFWNLAGRPFEEPPSAEVQEKAEEVEALTREALAAAEQEPPTRPEPKPEDIVELAEDDALPPYEPQPGDEKAATQSIELFTGAELDPFFESLARSDASVAGAVTRVLHWGDSAIGIDGIPGAIRARMQGRFGNAGHGFHLLTPPNTSYRHREVEFEHNDKWKKCFIIQRCKGDGRYGLGGATVWSLGGAQSRFAPDDKYGGGKVSRFDLAYLAHPKGGKLELRVDRGEPVVLDTRTEGELVEDRFHTLEVEDGDHELTVRAAGGGQSRAYGVTLERDVPGVVWDGLALVGAFTNRLGEFDEGHLRAQLDHRDPALAVFMFGGNDMIRASMTQAQYEQEFSEVVQLVRRADPDLACLIMAPLDHGEREGVRIVSRPIVPMLVDAQRNVAKAEGCAFFDTWSAMGGEGSAGRWFKQKPRLMSGDLGHATMKGHVVIGELVFRAILEQYVAYRRR